MSTLISGRLLTTISSPLDHEDLFLIGSTAWTNEMYEDALTWLHYAEQKLSSGKSLPILLKRDGTSSLLLFTVFGDIIVSITPLKIKLLSIHMFGKK